MSQHDIDRSCMTCIDWVGRCSVFVGVSWSWSGRTKRLTYGLVYIGL